MSNPEIENNFDIERGARLRSLPRVDYKKLHETGTWSVKDNIYRSANQSCRSISSSSNSSNSPPSSSPPGSAKAINTVETDILEVSYRFNQVHLFLSNRSKMSTETDEEGQLALLEDEINDFLDENCIDQLVLNIEDLDSYICRLEELRKSYRTVDRNLKKNVPNESDGSGGYEEKYEKRVQKNILNMKRHIMKAKEGRNKIRENQATNEEESAEEPEE